MRKELALVFLALLVFGCTTPAEKPINASFGSPFHLKINQSAVVDSENITIVFMNVTGDSRCPSNVQCIWEGAAHISTQVLQNGKSLGEFELSLQGGRGSSINVSSYSITMLDLSPYPVAGAQTNSSEYVATLVFSKQD